MFLVTGANGQLGSELRKLLGNQAVYVDRTELDITDESSVKNFLANNCFEWIINCAAYTAVDKAEDEQKQADAVNRRGPMLLAKYGKRLIHISTDYVFDGTNHIPYKESDQTNPISVYGKTKLEGEKAVMQYAETAIIIRTTWLYSAFGNNFVKTILHLGKTREKLDVVSDQIGSPTNASDLAKVIIKILPQIQKGIKKIYHFSNDGVCSWYDFAYSIIKIMGGTCQVNPIESKDYPTKAIRPYYSLFNKSQIKRDFGLHIRHWHDALQSLMVENKELLHE